MKRRVVAGHVIASAVSVGSSGAVYRARPPGERREVFIKVVESSGDAHAHARLLREAAILARVGGCRTPRVRAAGCDAGCTYLVLEAIDGRDVRSMLSEHGAFDPMFAARVLVGLLETLGCIHACGVVHRDVKPENVVVASDGAVHVVDFGVAKYVSETTDDGAFALQLTTDDTLLGSLSYMAPEQMDGGAASPSCDLYAAGALAFETLTGRVPFAAPTGAAQLALKRLREAPSVSAAGASGVPSAIENAVAALLRRSPSERPTSAASALMLLGAHAGYGRG